jgi:L-malate glycosyltransferase
MNLRDINFKVDKILSQLANYKTPSQLKVCFVTCEFPPDRGGISKSALRVISFLQEEGYELHVFAPSKSNDIEFTVENHIFLYRVPMKRDNYYREASIIIDQIDMVINFSIFHGFFLFMSFPCLLAKERRDRPVIGSIRGIELQWLSKNRLYRSLGKKILNEISWLTSVNMNSIKEAEFHGYAIKKSSFIPNSIPENTKTKWNKTPENDGVVGTVCTFRRKKNIPLLIEAYNLLNEEIRKNLFLVGDFHSHYPHVKQEIEELLEKRNIIDETIITGYITNEEISAELLKMNIFVISSDHEGLPNTILEAAAIGLPIVATNIDGISDIFEDGVDALLVPPQDPDKMSNAITHLLHNEKFALRLSEGAIKLAKKYNPRNEKNKWLSLYKQLLG